MAKRGGKKQHKAKIGTNQRNANIDRQIAGFKKGLEKKYGPSQTTLAQRKLEESGNIEEFNRRWQNMADAAQLRDDDPTNRQPFLNAVEEFTGWLGGQGLTREEIKAILGDVDVIANEGISQHVYDEFCTRWKLMTDAAALANRNEDQRHIFLNRVQDFRNWLEQGDGATLDREAIKTILREIDPDAENSKRISEYLDAIKAVERAERDTLLARNPHRCHWQEVVDLQDDMIRFWASPFGRAYGRAFGGAMINTAERHNQVEPTEGWTRERMAWAYELARIEQTKLQNADPVYINEEVQAIIEASIDSWPQSPLRREDVFPSMHGFAVFPRPFVVKDVHGGNVAFRAVAWDLLGPNGEINFEPGGAEFAPERASGVFLSAYAHRDDPDDYPIMQQVEEAARNGDLKTPMTVVPVMNLSYCTPWHFQDADPDKFTGTERPVPTDLTGSGLEHFCAVVRCMWALAQQKVTTTPTERLPKAYRKRAVRKGLTPDVVVVRLRHASPKNQDDAAEVHYSHRWLVRGHWRNQWYPSENRHKPVFIAGYVKGPDEAPLLVKPLRAFEFVR